VWPWCWELSRGSASDCSQNDPEHVGRPIHEAEALDRVRSVERRKATLHRMKDGLSRRLQVLTLASVGRERQPPEGGRCMVKATTSCVVRWSTFSRRVHVCPPPVPRRPINLIRLRANNGSGLILRSVHIDVKRTVKRARGRSTVRRTSAGRPVRRVPPHARERSPALRTDAQRDCGARRRRATARPGRRR